MTEFTTLSRASPTIRITSWTVVFFVIFAMAGSWMAQTEIVARGEGKIIPTSRTQLIQPLFRGKVQEITVTEGALVNSGDPLVILDNTEIRSEARRLSIELNKQTRNLQIAESILESTRAEVPSLLSRPIRFKSPGPDRTNQREIEISNTVPTQELIAAIMEEISSEVAVREADIALIENSLNTQTLRVKKADFHLKLAAQNKASAEKLFEKRAISNISYLERVQEFEVSETDRKIAEQVRRELDAKWQRTKSNKEHLLAKYKATYQQNYSDATLHIAALEAQLDAVNRRLENSVLTSPVSGYVENLSVHTIGGYVEAGQQLMSIVPDDGLIELEAYFENKDVGFIEVGQRALIKLEAYPSERFGFIYGTVTSVGADSRKIEQEGDAWVYTVRISVEDHQFVHDGSTYFLSPGMTGHVDIITGQRRLISYFFEPIIKSIQDSLKER